MTLGDEKKQVQDTLRPYSTCTIYSNGFVSIRLVQQEENYIFTPAGEQCFAANNFWPQAMRKHLVEQRIESGQERIESLHFLSPETGEEDGAIMPFRLAPSLCWAAQNDYLVSLGGRWDAVQLNNDYSLELGVSDGTMQLYLPYGTQLEQLPAIVNQERILAYPIDKVGIYCNEAFLAFDVAPQKENDRVLVPLRTIFEALGAEVSWNDERQQVTARRGEITVELTIGEEKMLKNDEVIQLDVPVKLVKDRTLIPIRAVAEAFGAKVEWNEGTQTVIIETN